MNSNSSLGYKGVLRPIKCTKEMLYPKISQEFKDSIELPQRTVQKTNLKSLFQYNGED